MRCQTTKVHEVRNGGSHLINKIQQHAARTAATVGQAAVEITGDRTVPQMGGLAMLRSHPITGTLLHLTQEQVDGVTTTRVDLDLGSKIAMVEPDLHGAILATMVHGVRMVTLIATRVCMGPTMNSTKSGSTTAGTTQQDMWLTQLDEEAAIR
ncbi:unnamed protein product [Parascedosporium putredinis]|uniref:Uncharacterized protein n=1 Tax=Parascedosporium putredinis TaxID=1442378 RepID=A0A9P1H915_9PEZI|nr:unnamed protein product [Parascedosporium putredinis]CAI8002610.1 unnamed protein product [Parascedosporium putredinis]